MSGLRQQRRRVHKPVGKEEVKPIKERSAKGRMAPNKTMMIRRHKKGEPGSNRDDSSFRKANARRVVKGVHRRAKPYLGRLYIKD